MAYPEPILPLEGKRARQFEKKWAESKLPAKKKRLYAGAREAYEKAKERSKRRSRHDCRPS